MSSKVKKIISGGFEIIKDSARQLGKTVSPDELLKQALGQQKSEFSDFLSHSGPELSREELEKRKKDLSEEEQEKLQQARKIIQAAIPPHLRPRPVKERLSPYEEKLKEEEEQKKAMAVEAKKKTLPVITPRGTCRKPGLNRIGRKQPKGFEGFAKDTKIG